MSVAFDLASHVDAQVAAYNAHDLDRFLTFFAEDFEFFDFPGTLRFRGRDAARERYGALFRENPRLKAQVRGRVIAAPLVVDHEFLYGHERRPDGANGIVIYEFDQSLIARVRSAAWSDRIAQ